MPKHKARVFLDSNVIFSGLHSPKGAPGTILELFIRGNISVVVSQRVLEEVVRTVKREIPSALPILKRLLENALPEVVADPELEEIQHLTKQLSIGDAVILGAVVASKPDYFVTGDKHFLGNPVTEGETDIAVLTPAQFLKSIRDEQL
jgi:putative PIN family toxin of toxin-antitoxin system